MGYMGCGKSTLGRALADELGVQFIDLDAYIEERYHKKVSEIFAEMGEQDFRQMERRMLEEVAECSDVVVACGGGTPCYFDNVALMNSRGLGCP